MFTVRSDGPSSSRASWEAVRAARALAHIEQAQEDALFAMQVALNKLVEVVDQYADVFETDRLHAVQVIEEAIGEMCAPAAHRLERDL